MTIEDDLNLVKKKDGDLVGHLERGFHIMGPEDPLPCPLFIDVHASEAHFAVLDGEQLGPAELYDLRMQKKYRLVGIWAPDDY